MGAMPESADTVPLEPTLQALFFQVPQVTTNQSFDYIYLRNISASGI